MFTSIVDFITNSESIEVLDSDAPVMSSDGGSFSVTYTYVSRNGNSGLEATKTYNLFEFLDFIYCNE